MIDKQYGKFIGVCDCCQEEETPRQDSFNDCLQWVREHGWRTRKNKQTGEWENYCPACAKLEE